MIACWSKIQDCDDHRLISLEKTTTIKSNSSEAMKDKIKLKSQIQTG